MDRSTLTATALSALLSLAPLGAFAADVTQQVPDVSGSALPPGINPSSPAGGNGADANGYQTQTPTRSTQSDANTVKPPKQTGTHTSTGQTTKPAKTKGAAKPSQ